MTGPTIEPVLLVEDKRPILSVLTTILAASGVGAMDVATGGVDAVRRMQSRRYGLVVCERFMQPISGIDLKLLMNTRKEWASIPFIGIISSEREGDARKREAAGMLHVVGFPLTAPELQAAIAAATRVRVPA